MTTAGGTVRFTTREDGFGWARVVKQRLFGDGDAAEAIGAAYAEGDMACEHELEHVTESAGAHVFAVS